MRRAARFKLIKAAKLKEKRAKPKNPADQNRKEEREQVGRQANTTEVAGAGKLTQEQLQVINLIGLEDEVDGVQQAIDQAKMAELSRLHEDRRLQSLFYQVGEVLSKYRSGPLPLAIKVVGEVQDWQRLLQLSRPEKWSSQAMHAVTKVLVGSLDVEKAAIFMEKYLLPAVRADIQANKKLQYHLYEALNEASFKANSWTKGIIFPLCQSGTLREVQLVTTLLRKTSFPVLNAAVALIKLAELPYSTPCIWFIKTLVEKKYHLPQRVLIVLTNYFCSFKEEQAMPVVWHQALLSLVEIYNSQLDQMGKGALRETVRKQHHHLIGPAILKLL